MTKVVVKKSDRVEIKRALTGKEFSKLLATVRKEMDLARLKKKRRGGEEDDDFR